MGENFALTRERTTERTKGSTMKRTDERTDERRVERTVERTVERMVERAGVPSVERASQRTGECSENACWLPLGGTDLLRANLQPFGDGGLVLRVRGDVQHQAEHVLRRRVNSNAVDSQERQPDHVGRALARVGIAMVLRDAEDVAGRTFKKTGIRVLEPMPGTSGWA